MNNITLVIMAAGMGSRFGGLKQIEPLGPNGEFIIDYSAFDAARAGFGRAVFVIKREMADIFAESVGNRVSKYLDVSYAFQDIEDLPAGYRVPEGRTKPWGTAHAVLAARNAVNEPFAVINADDFYGAEAFRGLADFLGSVDTSARPNSFAFAGYSLENTLTDNGTVARGVCELTEDGFLKNAVERTKIKRSPDGAMYEDEHGEWIKIPAGSIVSMNTWGFTPACFDELMRGFPSWLDTALLENPLKAEYFLPNMVGSMISRGSATVKYIKTDAQWYGVTYKEDLPDVRDAVARLVNAGQYEGM